jgi:hypothetical protein
VKALTVLASFETTLKENKEKLKKHERSELTLFEARIHEDAGNYEKALLVLNDKKGLIVD